MRIRRIQRLVFLAGVWLLAVLQAAPGQDASARMTGILSAFTDEVELLKEAVTDQRPREILGIRFVTGKLKGRAVVIASSGVGKVNAGVTAALMIEHFKPHEILYSGIAGAVNPELRPGDMVIAEKTVQHDLGTLSPEGMQRHGARNPIDWRRNPVFLNADAGLLSLAESVAGTIKLSGIRTEAGERIPKIARGIIATGDVFVASPAKREELRKTLRADAVEMEGAAVAQVCYQFGVPCLVIRCISDSADARAREDANEFLPTAAANTASLITAMVGRIR